MISAKEAKKQSKLAQIKIILDCEEDIDKCIKQHTDLGFTFATLRVNKNISTQVVEKLAALDYDLEILPFSYGDEEVIDISWV